MADLSYERELGGINQALKTIETTLAGFGSQLAEDRTEANQWREKFRQEQSRTGQAVDEALDALGSRTTALETDLTAFKTEERAARRLIWRVLFGAGAAGGGVVGWTKSAKAAVVKFFE